jgi:hypothetical protein
MKGTISGPGAMASPASSADQPHVPSSQSTIDSSMAPKLIEKKTAMMEAPLKLVDRNSAGGISGPLLFRQ